MPITIEDILEKLERGESLVGEGLRGLCFEKTRVEAVSYTHLRAHET